MNSNLQTVRDYFAGIGFKHQVDEEIHMCLAGVGLTNLKARLAVHAPPDEDFLTLVLILPVLAPSDRRMALGEFFLRLNRQLRCGAFELGFDDGEVRFRMAACLGDTPLTEKTLHNWMLLSATTVDGFFPVMMRVLFAGMRPDQALEQGEGFLRDILKQPGSCDE